MSEPHTIQEYSVRVAVLEEQLVSLRREIATQAVEYQRRLAELNHAHEKQVADQATYVSDDKFRGWQAVVESYMSETRDKLATIAGRQGGISSTRATMFQILAVCASTIIIVLMLRK
jgi:hypothetical protein